MTSSEAHPSLTEEDRRRLAGVAQRAGFAWADLAEAVGAAPRTGLGVMCRPGRFSPLRDDLALLRALGIEVVVDLTGGPVAEALSRDWIVHEIPVAPLAAPAPAQIERFCRLVDGHRAAGQSVVVHCEEGVGRAGTMAAAYVIHRRALTADAALELLRAVRPIGQSDAQETSLHAFARSRGYE